MAWAIVRYSRGYIQQGRGEAAGSAFIPTTAPAGGAARAGFLAARLVSAQSRVS